MFLRTAWSRCARAAWTRRRRMAPTPTLRMADRRRENDVFNRHRRNCQRNDMHSGSLLDWLNFIVLSLTLVCVAWYLRETHKIRQASEDQVKESQALVKAAQLQLSASHAQVQASQSQVTAAFDQLSAMRHQTAVALDQLEGQMRPALVARVTGKGVELVNIGSGPALHVQLSPADKGSGAYLAVH